MEDDIGLSAIQYHEWREDYTTHNTVKITEQACKDKNDWVVYHLFGLFLGHNRYYINQFASRAAQYNRIELLMYMISKGVTSWDRIVFGAARGGHKKIVNDMISRGVNNWDEIMCCAAKGGHRDIVEQMIEKGANNWNYVAYFAAKYGQKEIVELMVEHGANSWNWIKQGAEEFNHNDIVKYIELLTHINTTLK